MNIVVGSVTTLSMVSTIKEVRDVANEAIVSIEQNSMSRLVQSDLYNAINEFNGIFSTCQLRSRRSYFQR